MNTVVVARFEHFWGNGGPTYKCRAPKGKANSQRACFREIGLANGDSIHNSHQQEGHNELPSKSHTLQHQAPLSDHVTGHVGCETDPVHTSFAA